MNKIDKIKTDKIKTDKGKTDKGKIVQETAGILLFALAVYLFVALLSHTSSDPSFNTFLSSPNISVRNIGGIVGAYSTDILIQIFGAGAYAIPVGILILAWTVFRRKTLRRPLFLLTGGTAGYISFCALMNILDIPLFFETQPKAGGMIGWFATRQLLTFFNRGGALIVIITILLLCILLVTGISLGDLFLKTGAVFFALFSKLPMPSLQTIKSLKPTFKRKTKEAKNKNKRERKKKQKRRGASGSANDGRKDEDNGDRFDTQNDSGPTVIGAYTLPSLSFLNDAPEVDSEESEKEHDDNSRILLQKLKDFGVEGNIAQVVPGPVITMYELEPGTGVKVSRILNLSDDLALAMRAINIRIHAPVPGKSVVGIEIPNKIRDDVVLKDIMDAEDRKTGRHKLSLALGKDTSGVPVVTNLAAIPHLLIAGATGSGKSVGINAMICSILFNATPDEVKFIMIDPKMLELSIYDGIPHLISPVVTNPKKAANALRWAVEEMERRYHLLSAAGTRNIDGYNKIIAEKQKAEEEKQKAEGKGQKAESRRQKAEKEKREKRKEQAEEGVEETEEGEETVEENGAEKVAEKLPYIVIVIDELADLMMVASKDVETSLARLAQMARAAGLHLIVATQRPSVDVLTGLIKANFPARISFQVTSRIDSRTILDAMGAERLLGKGDMLFLPPGTSKFQRIHGAYISETEINKLVNFLKKQEKPVYDEAILRAREIEESGGEEEESTDEYYDQAVALVTSTRQASISMVQRRLRIGYNRAARLIEIMEKQGIVGPSDGAKPREVYARNVDDMEGIN